jgi:hypothetical protein
MSFGRIQMGLILISIILASLPYAGVADECEIIFPDTPPLNLDSIGQLIPHSFLDIVLTTSEGDTLVQPGYLISKDGKLLTCRSTYLEADGSKVMSSEGETLKIITKLAEDALADMIMLKITQPKQKMKILQPRYYFPDFGEELGVVQGSIGSSNPLTAIKVLKNGDDPFLSMEKSLSIMMANPWESSVPLKSKADIEIFCFPFR